MDGHFRFYAATARAWWCRSSSMAGARRDSPQRSIRHRTRLGRPHSRTTAFVLPPRPPLSDRLGDDRVVGADMTLDRSYSPRVRPRPARRPSSGSIVSTRWCDRPVPSHRLLAKVVDASGAPHRQHACHNLGAGIAFAPHPPIGLQLRSRPGRAPACHPADECSVTNATTQAPVADPQTTEAGPRRSSACLAARHQRDRPLLRTRRRHDR
jgi:hypothetical protein